MKRFIALAVAALVAAPAMADLVNPYGSANPFQIDLNEMDVVTNPDAYFSLPREQSGRAFGDTYQIGLLGQSTASAFFLASPGTTNQVYDGLAGSAGTHVVAATGALSAGDFEVAEPNGALIVGVGIFSNNSADLLPAGLTGGGLPISAIRLDMGAAAAAADALSPLASFDVKLAQIVLFSNGAPIFAANLGAGNGSFAGQIGQTALGDVAVINGAAGAGVDEIQFQYRITPEPSSLALLALAGLMGFRRR